MALAVYSSVPAVKRALVEQIKSALPDIDVERMHPGAVEPSECIYLGNVRGNHTPAAMRTGRMPRDEEYVLDLYCESVKPGPDAGDAEDRAFELLTAVEDTLANDNTLAGTLHSGYAHAGNWSAVTYFDEGTRGWGCTIRLEVAVKTRLA